MILVGAMETIYKDYTDKLLADLNLDYHGIIKLTHKLNEHSIRHASAHKDKVCTVGHIIIIIIRDNTLSLLKLCCPPSSLQE